MDYTAIMEHNYTRRKANACAALGAPSNLCESAKLGGWAPSEVPFMESIRTSFKRLEPAPARLSNALVSSAGTPN